MSMADSPELKPLSTDVELAAFLEYSVLTIRRWRRQWYDSGMVRGRGPKPMKIGNSVRYWHEDIRAYVKSLGVPMREVRNDPS